MGVATMVRSSERKIEYRLPSESLSVNIRVAQHVYFMQSS